MMTDQDDAKHGLDTEVEAAFATLRRTRPEPGPDLMARVLADAQAAQPLRALDRPRHAPDRAGWGARALSLLGGWGAIGGLATATIAGFVIGINPPDVIETPADAFFAQSDTLAPYDAALGGYGWDFGDQ